MTKLEEFLQRLTLQGIQLWPQDGRLRYAGPQHRITRDLLSQLKKHKSALLQHLSNPTYAPLSYGQRGLWSIQQRVPDNTAYNVSLAYRIHSSLDVGLLSDTMQLLVNRHPSLRTRFIWKDDQLVQQIDGYQAAAIETIDATDCSEAYLLEQARSMHSRPFDLSAGPLFRAAILRHSAQSYSLLLSAHHIVVDGWSIYQLIDELFTLYAALRDGMVAALPIIQHTYVDYVAWQHEFLQTDGPRLWSYWQEQLQGKFSGIRRELPVLQLPTDHPRPAQQSLRGISQPIHLPAKLVHKLRKIAQQNGCTLYIVLLAAYQLFLARLCGQDDILVGLPMAGRSRPEFSQVVGYFTSPVVVRATIGGLTFKELIAQVKKKVFAALDHQDYPFAHLVKQLNPKRDLSRSPIFQASFVLQKPHRAQEFILQSNKHKPFALALEPILLPLFEGQDDIALELMETSDGLFGHLKANADILTHATLARMVGHLQVLLEAIVANPLEPIEQLPLLTQAERHQLLVEWNSTKADYPADQCIHHLFEQQAERTPDATAVVSTSSPLELARQRIEGGPQKLSYRELNARANQLAHYLLSQGVGPNVLVGISLPRSLSMVVGLLGILKAGGAYVPLDPSLPSERLAFMLADANVPVLLTDKRFAEKWPIDTTTKILDFDSILLSANTTTPTIAVTPDDLAYVIYTSGSTGQPKGVEGLHRGAVNRLQWMWQTFPFETDEICCAKTQLSFIDSMAEIFAPLSQGIPVVIASDAGAKDPQQLVSLLASFKVTRLVLVPSLLRSLLDSFPDLRHQLPKLKFWVSSGEALSSHLCQRFHAMMPDRILLNLYGSSEVSADVIWYNTKPNSSEERVLIGRPIANTQAYLLDSHLQPVPIGVPSELYIGGASLGRGYLNRPELTKEKFIPNPFAPKEHPARLYKTGDLCRYLLTEGKDLGNIEFLGRIDHQVKLRGFRIELGEIEDHLAEHPEVREVVVVLVDSGTDGSDSRLVAYIIIEDGLVADIALSLGAIRAYLKEKVPDYMIPATFVQLEALPLNPNGKVDRRALPIPEARAFSGNTFVPPRTPTEEILATIWQLVLGVGEIGVHDNFFELGGHSLLATQVASRVRQAFEVEVSLRYLFEMPNIESLAIHIEELIIEELEALSEEEVI